MHINNFTALEFIDRIQDIEKSDVLTKIRLDLQNTPNVATPPLSLQLISKEFFRVSSSPVITNPPETSTNEEIAARENLLYFIAENKDLCIAINAQFEFNSTDTALFFTGLSKTIMDKAVRNNNVFFCLLGLKTLEQNLALTNVTSQYKVLHDGIIELAANRINMQPINANLESIRSRFGETSPRWVNFEGKLFNQLNEIQRKHFEEDYPPAKAIRFNPALNESADVDDKVPSLYDGRVPNRP